jgi:hypothetical protein
MTVAISPTEFNRKLSELVRDRRRADHFYIAGRTTFWRLLGLGLLACGLGIAVGLALNGYSYIRGSGSNLHLLSTALSKALSEVHLQASATGTVQLEPSTIALAKDQIVTLDPLSRLRLDPAASIRADGEITVQAPSISVPSSAVSVPSSRSPPRLISNFTVFKKVPYDNGHIVTGWIFLTSVQKAPSNQYCYYTRSIDSFNVDLDIATDQKLATPKKVPEGFDVLAAFNRCVWFKT